ncbi:MAG: translocation/assembly module TamB domain-containing protein [Treponema sp.]|jgi:hypothetical protein|nr:translocation/assembly module TamB domain-containing protein [Treponema sp.]
MSLNQERRPARPFSRLLVIILIFSLLAGFSAVILLNRALLAAMTEIRDGFISKVEGFTGYRLEYASLGPSVFNTLDLRNFRMIREDGSEFLSVSRLRFSYSIPALFQGKTAEAFRSVTIDSPCLNLDFEKDAGFFKLFTGRKTAADAETDVFAEARPSLAELLPDDFKIRIRNGEWAAMLHDFDFGIKKFNLDASVHKGGISFDGKWNAYGNFAMPVFFGNMRSASMTGQINGEYSFANAGGFPGGWADVSIPSLEGDFFSLTPFSFNATLKNNIVEIKKEVKKTNDKPPLAVSLYWDTDKKNLLASFSAENFYLRDMIGFTGPWKENNAWLSAQLSGQAVLSKQNGSMPLYSFDFEGSFPEDTLLGKGNFVLAADGSSSAIEFHKFQINAFAGNISYTGELAFSPFLSNGLLSVSELGLYGNKDEKISTDLFISTKGRNISVYSPIIKAGNAVLSELSVAVLMEDQGLSFGVSVLRLHDSYMAEQEAVSSLSLEGSVEYEPRYAWANMNLNSFPLRDAAELLRPFSGFMTLTETALEFIDGFSLTTEIFFNTDYKHILYNAPSFMIRNVKNNYIPVTVSFSGTEQHFNLDEVQINYSGRTLLLSGSTDFTNPNNISFFLNASINNMAYFFQGVLLDQNTISISGSYGFLVSLSTAGMTSWSGYAEAVNFPFPNADGTAQLSFLVSLKFDSPSFWSSELELFEIKNIPAFGGTASFSMKGIADQDGLLFQGINYNDRLGALNGSLVLSWDKKYKNYFLSAEIHDDRLKEHCEIEAAYEDSRLRLVFTGANMQIERMGASHNAAASGRLELDFESIKKFRIESELSSLVFRINGEDVKMNVRAVLDEKDFLLYDLALSYSGLEASVASLRADRINGLAETSAVINGFFQGRKVDIKMRGEAKFAALNTWVDIKNITDSVRGTIVIDRAVYDNLEADEPFNFTFSSLLDENGRRLNLGGGPRNMVRFLYSSAGNTQGGNFYAAFSAPSPVRGAFTGFLDLKNIDIRTSDLYIDLGSLWKLIPPQKTIAFSGGIVSASVHISGSLKEPDFFGTARATSIRMQVPEYISADIRPVPINISIKGNEMSFGPVEAAVGNGSGTASAWFRFDGWIPNTYNIDILVPGKSPIPFEFDEAGLIANGSASGSLQLSLVEMILTVSGDLTAQNAEISINSEEIAAREERGRWSTDARVSTTANLIIRTGRQVEFFWPSFDFPYLQAYADLGTSLHITSDASARRFSLIGNVRLRGGEIYYLERSFYIREGTLYFRENEVEFEPRISARAEIRDQGPEGPVTISMVIDNALLRSFVPRFESNPPLSQIEIFSMLGQNLQDDPARGLNIIISGSMDMLAQFTVIRRIQREVRNFLGLDMFSVRTQALQNLVFQFPGINDIFANTLGIDEQLNWNRAGTYFDKTTLFMGKYISYDIFGRAMINFRYDENRQTLGGMYFEPEIGLEMRNPLFTIEFNMLPLHPENWFIDGMSFTLSWRHMF